MRTLVFFTVLFALLWGVMFGAVDKGMFSVGGDVLDAKWRVPVLFENVIVIDISIKKIETMCFLALTMIGIAEASIIIPPGAFPPLPKVAVLPSMGKVPPRFCDMG